MWFSKLLRFAREGSLAVALTVGMVSAPIAYAAPASPAVTADAPAEGGDQPFWKKVDWQKWGNIITRTTDIASRVMGYMGQNLDPRSSTGKMAIGGMLTGLAPMIGYLVPPPAGVIAGAVMGVVGLGLTFWGRHQMKKEAEDALKNLPGAGGVGPVAVPGLPTDVGSERPQPGIPGGGGSGIPGGNGGGSSSTGNGASSPTDVATGPNGIPSDSGVGTPGSTGNGASGGSQPTVPDRRGIDDYLRDLPGLPGIPGSTGNGASSGNGGVATPGTGTPTVDPRTPVSGNGPVGDEGTNVGRNAGTNPNGSGTVAGPGNGRRTIDDYRGDIGGRGGVAGSGATGGSSTGVGVDRESRGGIDVGREGRTAGGAGIPGSGRIVLPGRGDRSGSIGTGSGPALSDVLAGRFPNRDRAVNAGTGATPEGNNVGRNADTRGTTGNGGVRRGSGVGIGQWR